MTSLSSLPEKIISDEAVFKILKHRYPFLFSKMSGLELEKHSFFQESVGVIARIEKLCGDIKNNVVFTQADYDQALEDGDQKRLKDICTYFSHLRHHEFLFSNTFVSLNKNYSIFKESYEISESIYKNRHNLLNVNSPDEEEVNQYTITLSGDLHNFDSVWNPITFPHKKVFSLVEKVRLSLEKHLDVEQKAYEQQQQTILEQFNNFDHLIIEHPSVYVACMDIRLINDHSNRKRENQEQFIQSCLSFIPDLIACINKLSGLLKSYVKIEDDGQLGLKLHTVLILKSSEKIDEEGLRNYLAQLIVHQSQGFTRFIITNWSEVIRTHFSKKAVGLIQSRHANSINAFKYWVLSYFFKVDSFIKFYATDQNGQDVPLNHTYSHSNPVIENFSLQGKTRDFSSIKPLKQLVMEQDKKSVWSTTHLSKEVQHYIKMARLVYLEDLSYGEWKHDIRLLIKIEIFVESCKHAKTLAFDISKRYYKEQCTLKELESSMTRIGKQFLILCENLDKEWATNWNFVEEENPFSYNVQLFLDYIKEEALETITLFSFPITYDLLEQVNQKVKHIYSNLSSLPISDQQESSAERCAIINYRNYQKREVQAVKYIKEIFKKDCVIYRMQFYYNVIGHDIKQSAKSKLFTQFIRLAKRAKPLSFMYGYIGRWQKDIDQNSMVHIIFLLNPKHLEETKNFISEMDQRWEEFLKDYLWSAIHFENDGDEIKTVQNTLEEDTVFTIEPIMFDSSTEALPLMNSIPELNSSVCHIETIHKSRQQAFIKNVIPYFAYKDLFEPELTDKPAKRFIKGTLPRQKRASKKPDSEVAAE